MRLVVVFFAVHHSVGFAYFGRCFFSLDAVVALEPCTKVFRRFDTPVVSHEVLLLSQHALAGASGKRPLWEYVHKALSRPVAVVEFLGTCGVQAKWRSSCRFRYTADLVESFRSDAGQVPSSARFNPNASNFINVGSRYAFDSREGKGIALVQRLAKPKVE